jgi:protein O-GlcNAc transferase
MEMTIEKVLFRAVEAHKAGNLQEAETLYRAILQAQPKHPDTNHNLGVIAVSLNKTAAALQLFEIALKANPSQGQFWLSYVDTLVKDKQFDRAKSVLEEGKKRGLAGEKVDDLEVYLTTILLTSNSELPSLNNPSASTQQLKKVTIKKEKKKNVSRNLTDLKQTINPPQVKLNTLLEYYQKGQIELAQNLATTLTQQYPNHPFGWKVLGALYKQTGKLKEAMIADQKALEISPNDAEAHSNLGVTLQGLSRLEEAVVSFKSAIAIKPNYAEAHSNLAITMKELGRLDDAEASYKRAVQIKPDFADAHMNLGITLQALGRLKDAEKSYNKAIAIKPNYAIAYNNLGTILKAHGRLEEAEASFKKAIAIKADYAEAYSNLGVTMQELFRLQDAKIILKKAIAINPDYAEAHYNLGITLKELGRLEDAEESYKKAIAIKPDHATAYNNLGVTLKELGRLEDAEESYKKAIAIKPDYAIAYNNLGTTLKAHGRLAKAEASFKKAIAIEAHYAEAHSNLGVIFQDLSRLSEAQTRFKLALELDPQLCGVHSNLIFCMSQSEDVDAKALFLELNKFEAKFEEPLRSSWPVHSNVRDPARLLRVGFVSADFRNHPVANFIEPVLEGLARDAQLTLHAYYNFASEDTTTERIKGFFSSWIKVVGLSDEALSQKIREDGIDILIDLSSHTAHNRLLTFARKPAPLQVSWIGYPGSTGLHAIDYYFSDRHCLPQGQFEDQFTEKIVRLPAAAAFLPLRDAPPVNALPALTNGYITFGSFNRPNKITRGVIALWSNLLKAVPDARLVLGAMPQDSEGNVWLEWFEQEGIDAQRLTFYPKKAMVEYLALHHQVDICLDTFPYNGGTTSWHAIWMGVPTLTLAGETVAGRSGVCILGQVGLESFVAQSKEEFVQKGRQWATDIQSLSHLRAGMRSRFEQSAAGKPEVVAAGLAQAMRVMWQRWCENLPVQSFNCGLIPCKNIDGDI